MASDQVKRRLAAILAADIAGYSRLMGADEEGTLARLKAYRSELIDPKNKQHRGRIVKTTGDGILMEFPSVVDALRCAIEVQQGMIERNADVPQEKRIEFRVGVNLGDVMIEGRDLYGDGVNIAARLEALAEPGGICISQTVLNHARDKMSLEVEDVGEQTLKNIARPVHVYRIIVDPSRRQATAFAKPALALPDKPSIAVLPLQNMSGDPEQEYFADGVAEDIITALSKFRWFFVIARNSSFVYKGQAVDVKRVGRELGVRYVLEGSVRKAGNRVRVSTQLIDAATGNHVWAERYDRNLADIFAVQDEITQSVVSAIEPELQRTEVSRVGRKTLEEHDAYDLCRRGRYHFNTHAPEGLRTAAATFRQAIALMPDLAEAHVGLSRALLGAVLYGGSDDRAGDLAESEREARRALAIDDQDAVTHFVLALYYCYRGEFDSALAAAQRAVSLNPNSALGHFRLGQVLIYSGHMEEGLAAIDVGLRLSPSDPQAFLWLTFKGWAFYLLDRYDDALIVGLEAKRLRAMPYVYRLLIATYGQLGRHAEAEVAIAEAKAAEFDGLFGSLSGHLPFANPAHRAQIEEGLRKAGLAE